MIDTNRVLLVFAPANHDPRLQQQLALFNHHAAEMKDRDLILITNLPDTAATNPDQLATRKRFHIARTDFTVILLGKDGDEKLRAHVPISIERLNRIIDAMPMRQQEIRDRKPHP